jgi:glycosyltransferase involved in cell wall biosynthesis
MKLAFCIEYPIDQHGGTEVLVRELIRGLSPRHQILLVSADDCESFSRSSVANLVAEHIQWRPPEISSSRSKELAAALAQSKPDLVHFHFGESHAWKSRAFWKCPIVHVRRAGLRALSTNHGAFPFTHGWENFPLRRCFFIPAAWFSRQYVVARLETEVAVSENDFAFLRRSYPLARNKFRRIYHSRLHGLPPPPNPARSKTILCAGTIGPRKAQTVLVEAFCRLAPKFPDWQLVLVGRDGDETMSRRIRELIAQQRLGNHIHLPGTCSDDELSNWLKQSAIFVMPSLHEGLGLSLQEAQFYGCACIGTRCGGVTDLIQEGENGLLVPAGEVAPLAEALERLMSDAALRERFGVRGPQSVLEKGMTAEKMVQAYENLYADILKQDA